MRIVYWLLATTALIVSTFAQTPNGTRKAWNDTLWIDRDGTYQLVDDYIDTQNQSTLQFKDTTQLKVASFDSTGFVVNLKQLSSANTNGGGWFVYRPAAEYTVDGVTCFASGNASYEWVRQSWLENKQVNVYWAGAKGDGVTNDSLAIAKAITVAKAVGSKDVRVPKGRYSYTGSIKLTATTNNNDKLRLIGDGIGVTILDPTDDAPAIRTSTGQKFDFNIDIVGMTILGPGAGSSTAAGIEYDSTSFGVIENVRINGFYYGIQVQQCNSVRLLRNRIEDCHIGIYLGPNSPNEFTIQNNYINSCDSIGIDIEGNTKGGTIISCAFIGNPVGLRIGTGGGIVLTGCNFESTTGYVYYLEGNTALTSLNVMGVGNTKLAYMNGTTKLTLVGTVPVDNVDALNTTAVVAQIGTNTPVTVTNLGASNAQYEAGLWEAKQGGSTVAAASTRRGQMQYVYQRNNTDPIDHLIFTAQKNDTTWVNDYLTDGVDWRYSTTGAQPARVSAIRRVVGYKTFTTSGGDSTVVSVVADTNGFGTFYYGNATIEFADAATAATLNWNITIQEVTATAGTGTVEFLVHHPSYGSATAHKLMYMLVFAPKYW